MKEWKSLKKTGNKTGNQINAMLGPGSHFEGNLHFEGLVRIDGEFIGEISSDNTLIVGKEAHVNASVEAGMVIVHGLVQGNVKAHQLLHVLPGGKILGNMLANDIKFEQGAFVEGNLMMMKGN